MNLRSLQIGDNLRGKTLYFDNNLAYTPADIGLTSHDGWAFIITGTYPNQNLKVWFIYNTGKPYYDIYVSINNQRFATIVNEDTGAVTPSITIPEDKDYIITEFNEINLESVQFLKSHYLPYIHLENLGYNVSFESNGGFQIDELHNQFNLPSELPIPKKERYDFLGWFNEDYTVQYFGGEELSEHITLYAKWELHNFDNRLMIWVDENYITNGLKLYIKKDDYDQLSATSAITDVHYKYLLRNNIHSNFGIRLYRSKDNSQIPRIEYIWDNSKSAEVIGEEIKINDINYFRFTIDGVDGDGSMILHYMAHNLYPDNSYNSNIMVYVEYRELTTREKLKAVKAEKEALKQLLSSHGVDISNLKFTEYHVKFAELLNDN